MNRNATISIIGYGVIGSAIGALFNDKATVLFSDPKLARSTSIKDISNKSDLIFICIPAPSHVNGEDSTSEIDDVLSSITSSLLNRDQRPLICIKTTLLPNQLERIVIRHSNLRICFSPEFVRDKHAYEDLVSSKYLVLGGSHLDTLEVDKIHRHFANFKSDFQTTYLDIASASLLKYMMNSFLALKVSFMNQFFDIHRNMEYADNWDKLVQAFQSDPRTGSSHYLVPGLDGERGWGGKCLPKDLTALLGYCASNGLDLSIISHICDYNDRVRSKNFHSDKTGLSTNNHFEAAKSTSIPINVR